MNARGHLHFVGKPQRQRQRGKERLAAGERIDAALRRVDMIDDVQLQTAFALEIVRVPAALEVVLPAGHFLEPEVRASKNTVKIRRLDVGFQVDFCLALQISGGGFR